MSYQNAYLIFGLSIVLICNIDRISTRSETSKNELLNYMELHEPRIINGTLAKLDETRHQVSIRSKRKDGYFFGTGHLCGGSLISENVVLSAAHCFVNYNKKEPRGSYYPDNYFIAVMGNPDRYDINNNTLIFSVLRVVKHSEIFNLETFQHDIALVMLDGKVPAEHPTLRPIILNDFAVKNNTLCQVTGWGTTEKGYESDVLLTVDLPIIDHDDCIEKTLHGNLVTEGMLCAGYLEGEKDACKGDSGGPLVCGGLQTGIISWGMGCAMPLLPGVFTNISFYKYWILEEVEKNNGTLPKFASDNPPIESENGHNDSVKSINCSLFLVSFLLVFNFLSCTSN